MYHSMRLRSPDRRRNVEAELLKASYKHQLGGAGLLSWPHLAFHGGFFKLDVQPCM